MIRSVPKPADREEWLEARHPYWNASSASALLDRHPFQSLATVVAEKLDGPDLEGEENSAMRRGRHLEHAIASWWEDENGLALYEPTQMYVNGIVCATLDRSIIGVEDRAVEIKSTAMSVAEPERYWLDQCQLQMYAADLSAIDLVALDASMQLQHWVILRDDELIQKMVDIAETIMSAVKAGRWPAIVSRADPGKPATGASIELDGDTADTVRQLASLRSAIREMNDEADHLKKLIVQRLGSASVGVHDGRNLVRNVTTTRLRLDEKRLRDDHPELLADYQKSSTYSTLRVLT